MMIYLLVRRKKTNIFLEAQESDTVLDIKLMIEGILKRLPQDQQLYYLKESTDENAMSSDESSMVLLQDNERLLDRGITAASAKAQAPARLGLCFRDTSSGQLEQLDITPYSSPPPLPDIMKAPVGESAAGSGDRGSSGPGNESNKQREHCRLP